MPWSNRAYSTSRNYGQLLRTLERKSPIISTLTLAQSQSQRSAWGIRGRVGSLPTHLRSKARRVGQTGTLKTLDSNKEPTSHPPMCT